MKNDYRKKTKEELLDLVKKTKEDIAKKSLDIYQGKEKNLKVLKPLQKEVAQMMTVIKEKEVQGE